MKTATVLMIVAMSGFAAVRVMAQGSLTPPGAPAPIMKTLNQVEPRTPISSVPFTISQPGSYYVTTNLTPAVANQNGIVIAADNVTLDLAGFTLFGGGGGSGEGISASGARTNIVIRNGTLRNWPGSGVNLYDSGSSQAIIQDIRAVGNGFTGIALKNSSRAVDCVASANGQRGILVDNDCRVERCKAAGNGLGGIAAGATCQLLNNQSTGNGSGLTITGAGNIVANNIVKANTDNYSIAQGNQLDLLLCEIPESIDWSAKVTLVGSLTVAGGDAITITANGVTVDLNGFTIASTAASAAGTGIFINSGLRNLAILNGFIQGGVTNNGSGVYSGSGFGSGIFGVPQNARVSGVSVSGCLLYGIYLEELGCSVVESCTVQTTGSAGITAPIVKASAARDCGGIAILGVQLVDCLGESAGSATGVSASTAQNCIGFSSSGAGLSAITAQNCIGISSSGIGLAASSTAIGCQGQSGSGTGLSAFIANSCAGQSTIGTPQSITHKYNMP